ncbi:hypothetical protein [Streptomyces sp. NPDC003710]
MTDESSHESSLSDEPSRPDKSPARPAQYIQPSFRLSKSVLSFQSAFAEIAKQRNTRISALLAPQLTKPVLDLQSTFAEIAKQRNTRISALLAPQLTKPVLDLQSTFAEIAKQHSTSLSLGLGAALTDAIKGTSLQRSRTVWQFADLARATSAFTAGFSALSAQERLTSQSVIPSAAKLSRIYENHPVFRSVPSQAAVITIATVDADIVDASARDLAEDEVEGLDIADLADALLKQMRQAEEGSAGSGRRFQTSNIAPGALFLGVLVLLYSAASDVAGMASPELSALLDRQFTYASLAMATLYFLYQEGKR